MKNKIRKARKYAKLTQTQLAEKLGVFKQNISQYETGKRNPKLKRLKEIAEICNVPIDFFL